MAISWATYRSVPFLKDYAAAKKWHDDTPPIRGDEHKTRPCGRRNQKWFSIWEEEDAVHVGYNNTVRLVTFKPSGEIIVPNTRHRGASTHERLSKLLGENFRTHQYDTWLHCSYYDSGEHKRGYMPLRKDAHSVFVRQGSDDLVFVNYKFPVTHHVNKEKLKELLHPFVPFLTYVEGMAKLQERKIPEFSKETIASIFGWREGAAWSTYPAPVAPPSLFWGSEASRHLHEMLALATSDDSTDKLRAAITLCHNARWGNTPREMLVEHLARMRPDDMFDKREHREGKLVKDRYRRFVG